jgi:hypothetical protein
MSLKMVHVSRIAGLVLGLGCLAACDGGEGTAPPPGGGGAGIPKLRGPVSPNMPKPGAGKAGKVQGTGPAARRAAPAPVPDSSDSGVTPPAPKE